MSSESVFPSPIQKTQTLILPVVLYGCETIISHPKGTTQIEVAGWWGEYLNLREGI